MIKFAILFALVAAAFANRVADLNPLSPTGRIVGGVSAPIEDVPWQVSLQFTGIHFCGGGLISNFWILTAAHCLVYPPFLTTVRTGTARSSSGGSLTRARTTIRHPNYGSTRPHKIPINDIGLVELRFAITVGETQAPIPLIAAGEECAVGSSAIITGWGALREGGLSAAVLQTVTIPIVSKADCSAAYSNWGGLPENQICAAVPEGGLDACQGDSGGPLVIDGRLAGVVSWGNGCAKPGYPGVYSEVASYRDWITTRTGI